MSSSIIENTLIYNLDYLICHNITEVIMLQENHVEFEYENKFSRYAIKFCDKVSSAITMCDVAIIIAPSNIQKNQYQMIFEYVKSRINETYYFDFSDIRCNQTPKSMHCSKNIPTVLVLAIGRFHQVLNLELALNELFLTKKVAFKQTFSYVTANMLEKFERNNLLNSEIVKSIHTACFDIQITTLCHESCEEAFNDLLLLEVVQNMNPSYVFLVGENDLQEKQEIIDAFQKRLNCYFNSVFFSDYVSVLWYDSRTPILITNKCNPHFKYDDYEEIWNSIIRNIAFPERLKVMRANRQHTFQINGG